MHGANAHYGHRAILNKYAQVADGTALPGLLQHGWNHDMGATLADIRVPHPEPFYTWSPRNLTNCRRSGQEHVVGIGSPFLYLPALAARPQAAPGSLLAIPIHGWELEHVQQDFTDYARALGELSGQFSRITICMYWYDHQFAANRKPFEDLGMTVVTVGHRDANPAFLPDMRDLLLRHACVTSNRAQTGLFYGMYLGLPTFLYGPPTGVEPRLDHSGHLWDAWQQREFPQLAWSRYQGDAFPDIGGAELGLPFHRSPEALRDLLLWQPDQRPELDRRVAAFRVRTSQGARRWWHRVTGRMAAARALPPLQNTANSQTSLTQTEV